MTKHEFLKKLEERFASLPLTEKQERLTFYGEMIDDRMEEGLSEEEAVRAIGDTESIPLQTAPDTPSTSPVSAEKDAPPNGFENGKRSGKTGELVILLLILGALLWLSLLIAAFAVLLSLFAVLWSAIVSLYAVFASLVGCAVGGVFSGTVFLFTGKGLSSLAMIGAGLVSAGLSVFFFFLCKACTKGAWQIGKKTALAIKQLFVRKGNLT